jgi:ribonuclease G
MEEDRAQHTILPLSKFGLMQITRQRVRPSVKIDTQEVCPTCQGTGKSSASILVTDNIQRDLDFLWQNRSKESLSITVHPFVKSYLKQGFYNQQWKWFFKYNRWIGIKENSDYNIFQYNFHDKNGDEIRLD